MRGDLMAGNGTRHAYHGATHAWVPSCDSGVPCDPYEPTAEQADADHAVVSQDGWTCEVCSLPVNGTPSDGDSIRHLDYAAEVATATGTTEAVAHLMGEMTESEARHAQGMDDDTPYVPHDVFGPGSVLYGQEPFSGRADTALAEVQAYLDGLGLGVTVRFEPVAPLKRPPFGGRLGRGPRQV